MICIEDTPVVDFRLDFDVKHITDILGASGTFIVCSFLHHCVIVDRIRFGLEHPIHRRRFKWLDDPRVEVKVTDPARRIVPYCAILFIMDERLCQQIWPRTMPRKAVAHTSKSISSPKSIRDVCRKITCCVSMSRVSPGHVSETSAPGRDRVLSGLRTFILLLASPVSVSNQQDEDG